MEGEFSLGRPVGRKEKRDKKFARQLQWVGRRTPSKYSMYRLEATMPPTGQSWLLVTPDNWLMCYYIHQLGIGKNAIEVVRTLRSILLDSRKNLPPRYPLFVPAGTEVSFLLRAIKYVMQHIRLVNVFRCLARRWLRSRFKNGNEEDLLTGEVPKKPVSLRVWSERTIYTFEANTILRDMVGRLLTQEYLFGKYLMPRNPYTNCIMSYNQFLCVMDQLRRQGYSHWALEGLLLTQYNREGFIKKFGATVKKEIILREFKKPGGDVLDITFNFIEGQYVDNNKEFSKPMYRWALANLKNNIYIRRWIDLCRDHHLIIYTDADGKSYKEEVQRIYNVSASLCDSDKYIRELYEKEYPGALDTVSHIYTYTSVTILVDEIPPTDETPSLHGFWLDDSLDGDEVPAADVHTP